MNLRKITLFLIPLLFVVVMTGCTDEEIANVQNLDLANVAEILEVDQDGNTTVNTEVLDESEQDE